MDDLGPFRATLRQVERNFAKSLAHGRDNSYSIAVSRLAIELMRAQLKESPTLVLGFRASEDLGHPADLLWYRAALQMAERRLDPSIGEPDQYRRRIEEHRALGEQMKRNVRGAIKYITGREITIVRHNPQTIAVIDEIAWLLPESAEARRLEPDFMRTPAILGLRRLLFEERPDLFIALRVAQRLPADETVVVLPEERSTFVDAAELAIGLIPVIGSVVAAIEVYRGKDLFGNALSDVERGILGASVLLPIAGRVVKSGRALYTARRMTRLYGDDAFRWSYTLAMGERLSADAAAMRRIAAADEAIAAGRAVERQTARELANDFKRLRLDTVKQATPTAVDPKFAAAFEKLVASHDRFAVLDPPAIGRVAKKAPNPSHTKGQLLEELLESRVVSLLREPAGKHAFGLGHITEQLEFVPGHLIRDGQGRQITDGMIVSRVDDRFDVHVVFEAKAGRHAARELSRAATSRGRMSKEALAELRAYARDVLEEQHELARHEGRTLTKTVEDVMREISGTEAGGQVRRDVERLMEMPEILIGSTRRSVRVTPKTTRFVGVLPSDVKPVQITQQLAEAGLKNFEVFGVGITQKELDSAAKIIVEALAAR